MGRRDAVQFTLELAAEWRRLGARVTFEPGWETRGNGTSANYEGCVVHHTVGASSPSNPLPSKNVLKDGRTGLSGPLCNSAGPYCEEGDPWIHVLAAHPSNNAGASGGKSMGPLPVTSLFNPLVWGHEIDYLGDRPMTKGQYKSALIVGRGVVNVLARSTEYVRAHAETSITGKWDPGFAPGKTIDMADFRRSAASDSFAQEDDMFSDADREVLNYLKGIISWGFDPTLGKGPAFGQPGQITNTLAALRYLLDPAGGEAEGEVLLRLRSIQGLVSDPAAFAAALAPHLGSDVDQATVEAGVRAVLGGLDAA